MSRSRSPSRSPSRSRSRSPSPSRSPHTAFYCTHHDQGILIEGKYKNELSGELRRSGCGGDYPECNYINHGDFMENAHFLIQAYQRYGGGWEITYMLRELHSADGTRIDDVPSELEEFVGNL